MSYDITLNDPVTGEVIEFDYPHQIRGGTYAMGGTTEAWINVTSHSRTHYYRVLGVDTNARVRDSGPRGRRQRQLLGCYRRKRKEGALWASRIREDATRWRLERRLTMLTFDAEYARDQAIHAILDITEEVADLMAENRQLKADYNNLKDENDRIKGGEPKGDGCEFCVPNEKGFARNLLTKTTIEGGEDVVWEVFIDPKHRALRLTRGKFISASLVIGRCPMCGRKL